MKIRFWGVRGSLPTPPSSAHVKQKYMDLLRRAKDADISTPEKREQFIETLPVFRRRFIGGNTSCVQVNAKEKLLVFDMGSGLKRLGNYLLESAGDEKEREVHIFISHTHWDHIMGFPFFTPAYLPNTHIIFHSPFTDLEERLRAQQDFRFFPVDFDDMASTKEFHTLPAEGEYTMDGVTIRTIEQHHPGASYGYRIEADEKSFIYSTDSEYKDLSRENTQKFTNFFQDADVMTFDSQYTLLEAVHHKKDWGHSSAIIGIDLCAEANVNKMVLFHHEPENDDNTIQSLLEEARQYKSINYPDTPLTLAIGYEGLEIEL
ncbi:MAG: Ribonuclease BN [Candidatus Marinimicrobia bacterium]|nr:Ribonuclease BN [Candidatus Neomarinimicrobiota bacterium]